MTDPVPANFSQLGLDRSYSPAIIERFARLVDRLPLPAWAFFLLLLLAGYILFTVGRWLTSEAPGIAALPAPVLIWDVSILALHQYLDRYALAALSVFNRSLHADDEQLAQLGRRLTVMPLRFEIMGAVFWCLLATALVWLQLDSFLEYFAPWEIVFSTASFAIGGAFFVHVIYQLRLVSRIHASARDVDLFDPGPLYSFSGLTVRTAVGIVLVQYAVLLVLPGEIRTSTILVPVASVTGLAVVVFVWPLWGMHRRLVERKEHIEGDINALLKQAVTKVTAQANTGVVEDPETLEKTLSALRAAQATVADLPTWPWQPSTVRGFATALLLPIAIFLLQELLAELAGL